jgi:hypothetical protein
MIMSEVIINLCFLVCLCFPFFFQKKFGSIFSFMWRESGGLRTGLRLWVFEREYVFCNVHSMSIMLSFLF